jgi:phospholipid transport system substrate-binding protein
MRARFGFGRRAVIQPVERRWVLMGGAALGFGALLPARAVQALVSEINTIINSGTSETAMYREFERVFIRYADVPIIARSALGIAARGASDAQMNAFTLAFQGYISRKYGSRFREFIGGNIEVEDARQIKSFYEVISTAYLRGEAPFEVRWHVSNKSGRDLFFNLIIEGINMVAAERTEIGALLDERGGNIEQLTKDLRSLG